MRAMTALIDDWERAGRYLELMGHRIFVLDRAADEPGARDPVLVLHGFPTSSFDWRPTLPVLARRRRVVIPDYLGFGLSEKPDQRYSIFELADLVVAGVVELGLTSVVLVTHDLGDSVGGELLARALDGRLPFEVAQRVITNGSIYMELVQLSAGQQLLLSLPDERLPEDGAPDQAAIASALRGTFAPESEVASDELDALAALVARDGGNRLLPRTIRYIEERRAHEGRWTGAIERHSSPLTIIWGDLDPIAVWPMADRLARVRPEATLVRLSGVGHYPMLEAPDSFNAALEHALG
jgi:pimeloyl-ACP methyl ester carboxylesterase